VQTEVTFRALSPAELEGYIGSGEWQDKAGAYAVQGLAAAFVRSVRGSYTNIVGLPLCEVIEDLDALGALPADWALGSEKK
jgi:septum formation protein